MKNKFTNCLFAFTLAEVLITLAIIGVIAALTIPILLNNSNDTQIITGIKKAYSNLSNTYSLLIADYSDMPSAISENSSSFINTLTSKLKVAKYCGYASAQDTDCFPNKIYKYLNGNNYLNFATNSNYATFLTVDNIAYAVYPFSTTCNSDQSSGDASNPLYNSCALIWVDVNGPNKGPSVFGRDLFNFSYTLTGVFPTGSYYNSWFGFGANCTTSGQNCTAKIINEGAINY